MEEDIARRILEYARKIDAKLAANNDDGDDNLERIRITDDAAVRDIEQMNRVHRFLKWDRLPLISPHNVVRSLQRLFQLGRLSEGMRIPTLGEVVRARMLRDKALDLKTFARSANGLLARPVDGVSRASVEAWCKAYIRAHPQEIRQQRFGDLQGMLGGGLLWQWWMEVYTPGD